MYSSDPVDIPILRLSTAGSVDDGKSTLIGRLLMDAHGVFEDQIAAAHQAAEKKDSSMMLALLTDGLKAEREQGITIDVAYRYFSTERRRFILADSPGHEQYTRNMATGASTADATIVLVDAKKGILTQTKRHACIASLLGVPRLIVAINKMDLVDYSQKRFEELVNEFEEFAPRLNIKDLSFFPVVALSGDNVVDKSDRMPWYHGKPLLEHLENIYIGSDRNSIDFRFPIQYVIRSDNYRGYAGQIISGVISAGEELLALPSKKTCKIKSIDIINQNCGVKSVNHAQAGMSVSICLDNEIDLARGDLLVRPRNQPKISNQLDLMLVWMSDNVLDLRKQYLFFHGARQVQGYVDEVLYKLDVNSLSRLAPGNLTLNEIGRVSVTLKSAIAVDRYNQNRLSGSMVLIDPDDFQTVAAAMVLDRDSFGVGTLPKSGNLHEEKGLISKIDRERLLGSRAVTFWFTGLSGSGKSTLASALEDLLHKQGKAVYRLDGDNLRLGLNKDLGFSVADRTENIRRVAEVSRLFNDAGVIIISSFISPIRQDREMAREVIGKDNFFEIFVDAPIEICEGRDPHGMYQKAREGKIKNFTGVSAPYEPPVSPDLILKTSDYTVQVCLQELESLFKKSQSVADK